jgi:thymidylate synthase (FAD)
MGEVLFHLKVPIMVVRQLIRHRTANVNEVSARYSELPNEFYIPPVEDCGPQSKDNKQGRTAAQNLIKAKKARQNIETATKQSYDAYDSLLNVSEVSREISRGVLPVFIFTELYWKCDLHNFFHFAKLRLDPHAQKEIRIMAQAMFDLVRPHFPIATAAFDDYILNTKTFSAMDLKLLSELLQQCEIPSEGEALQTGMSKREYNEFCTWLKSIQIV